MRKFTISLILLLTIALTALAQPRGSIYYEDFSSGVPSTWSVLGADAQVTTVAKTHSAPNALAIGTTTANAVSYVVLPSVTATNLIGYKLNFWVTASNKNVNLDSLRIGYMTDPADPSTFVKVAALGYNETFTSGAFSGSSSTYVEQTIDITGIPAGAHVAFRSSLKNASYKWWIDDVALLPIYNCQSPINLRVNALTHNSADLYWDIPGADHPEYGDVSNTFNLKVTDLSTNTVVITDNGFTPATLMHALSGLQPATTYEVELSTDCQANYHGTSAVTYFQFTTLNAPLALPYSENFNSLSDLPTPYYSMAYLESYTTHGNSGMSIRISGTYANPDAYVVLPQVNAVANNMEISFWYNTTSVYDDFPFSVMAVTDPTDLGSAIQIYSTTLPAGADWTEVIFNTGNLTETATPLMLMFYASSAGYVYIDDVTVTTIPTCPRPDNIVISNVLATTFDVAYNAPAGSTVTVFVSDAAGNAFAQEATSNPYTFTGLTPQTTYSVSLVAACSATDMSAATSPKSITTSCAPLSSPLFFEGFENTECAYMDTWSGDCMQYSEPTPACWTSGWIVEDMYDSPQAWDVPMLMDYSTYSMNPVSHTGNIGIAVMPYQSQGTIVYLSSNRFNIAQAGTYSATIWMDRTDSWNDMYYEYMDYYNAGISLWATPNPGDTTGGTLLGRIHSQYDKSPVETAPGWYQYEFPITRTGDMYLTIVGYSDGEYDYVTIFDDIEITAAAACAKVSNITFNNNVLTWNAGGNESQWSLHYTLTKGSSTIDSTVVVSSPSYTLPVLSPASHYTLSGSVTALCSATDLSQPVNFSFDFYTECAAISEIPYTCSFEADGWGAIDDHNSILPMCWDKITNFPTDVYIDPYSYYSDAFGCQTYSSQAHTGSSYLSVDLSQSDLYYGEYHASKGLLILPEMASSVTLSDLAVEFYMNAHTALTDYFYAVLGVMTDRTDESTFVAVDSVQVYGSSYSKYQLFLNGYTGTGRNIALRFKRSTSNVFGFIDDVTVLNAPACANIRGDIFANNVTYNSAEISAADASVNAQWQLGYREKGTSTWSVVDVNNAASTSITNLNSYTEYEFRIRKICSETEMSDWTGIYTFRTLHSPAVPATLPYVCGFEDDTESANWRFTNNTVDAFVVGTATDAVNTGSKALYISNNGTDYNFSKSTLTYAYRTIHFDSKVYDVQFQWKAKGNSETVDFGFAALMPVTTNYVGGNGVSYSNFAMSDSIVSFTPVTAAGRHILNKNSRPEGDGETDWHTFYKRIDMSNRAGDYNVVFVWSATSTGTSYQPPLAIDNLSITHVVCEIPAAAVNNLTSSSFDIECSNLAPGTNWQLVVATSPFFADAIPADAVYNQVLSTASATITGATPNTDYYYMARAICGAGDTSRWSDIATVHTYCITKEVPYTENFESDDEFTCWSVLSESGSVSRESLYAHGGVGSMKIDHSGVVSPEFNITGLAPYVLTGYVMAPEANTLFTVGVISDPADASTYEEVTTVNVPYANTWVEFNIYFDGVTAAEYEFFDAKHFGLFCNSGIVYFDDVNMNVVPACPKPAAPIISNVTANSFDLSFSAPASQNTWYVTVNNKAYTINSNPYTFSNFSAHTNYNVRIAAACGNDTSEWVDCGTVMTACGALKLPYRTGFEAAEGWMPVGTNDANFNDNCWNVIGDYSGSLHYTTVTTNSSYTNSGSQALFYSSYPVSGNVYLVLPEFLAPSNSLQIDYVARFEGSASNKHAVGFELGYMTDPADTTTFVSIYTTPTAYSYSKKTVQFFTNTVAGMPANARLAIKANPCVATSNTNYYRWGLDDLSIKEIRSCSDPESVTVLDRAASTASFAVVDTCAAHTTYEYAVGPYGFDPDDVTPVQVSDSFTVTGLDEDALYTIAVRAVCGTNDVSNWVTADFHTRCNPVVVTEANPFFDSFEDAEMSVKYANECYDYLNTTASYYFNGQGNTEYSTYGYRYSRSGQKALHASAASTIDDGIFLMRAFSLEAGKTYKVTGYAINTTSNTDVDITLLAGTYNEPWRMQTLNSVNIPYQNYVTNKEGTYSWYDYSGNYVPVVGYIEAAQSGIYYVAVQFENHTTSSPNIIFDDFSVEVSDDCVPSTFAIDGITTSSAAISINDAAAATKNWEYELRQGGNVVQTGTFSAAIYTLADLNGATDYTVALRHVCGNDDNSMWITVDFRTECGITAIPFVCGFEASEGYQYQSTTVFDGSDVARNCWSVLNYGRYDLYGVIRNSSTISGSQNYGFTGYGYDASSDPILILPEFDHQTSELLMTLDYYNSNYSNVTLSLGYVTDLTDFDSWVELNRFKCAASARANVEVDFAAYDSIPNNAYIAIRPSGINGSYFYIDNVNVIVSPTCHAPRVAPIVTSIDMTSASLEVDMANAQTVIFGYGLSSDTDMLGTVSSATGKATITGLTANTSYKFYARYICQPGDTSDWSNLTTTMSTMSSNCFAPVCLRTVGEVGSHNVTMAWGVVPDATYYHYELKSNGVMIDSANVTADSVAFTNLTPSTTYTFRVRTDCSASYSSQFTFTTIDVTYELPFICDFETVDEAAMFSFVDYSSPYAWPSPNTDFVVGTAEHSTGSKSLYASNNNGTSASYDPGTGLLAKTLLNLPAGQVNYSYDWKCLGDNYAEWGYYQDYGMAYLVPEDAEIDEYICNYMGAPMEAIPLIGMKDALCDVSAWTTETGSVMIPEAGKYYLMFTFYADEYGYSPVAPSFCVDNISVTVPGPVCETIEEFPYFEGFETMTADDHDAIENNCWEVVRTTSGAAYITPESDNVFAGTNAMQFYNGNSGNPEQIVLLPEMSDPSGMAISFVYKTGSDVLGSAQVNLGYYDALNDYFVSMTGDLPHSTAWSTYEMVLGNLPAGVRLAFRSVGTNSAYIDNVRINNIVNGEVFNDTVCHNTPYQGHGFSKYAADMTDGNNTFTRVVRSEELNVADSVITLNVFVRAEIITEVFDTICANTPYVEGMWNIASPRSTQPYDASYTPYTQQFTSVDGCDSTVTLHLMVLPAFEIVFDTICMGDARQSGNSTYTATGVYNDTVLNALGCPMVVTLNLLVVDTVDSVTAAVCEGTPYEFYGNSYSQSGIYSVVTTGTHGCPLTHVLDLTVVNTDSTINVTICEGGQAFVVDTLITEAGDYDLIRSGAAGCDLVYHVHVDMTPVTPVDVFDYVCEGSNYFGYELSDIEVSADTVITVNRRTLDSQCDSVVNVHISFIPTTYADEWVGINYGESYEWHDNTYTESGEYADTLKTDLGCDSVVVLHLTVPDGPDDGEGVDNVVNVRLDVVPNPVRPSMTAYIYGEYGDVEYVEVLNNFGQVVDRFTPASYPVEVQGIEAAGLYYVRLITTSGNVYTEKLIVK